MKKIFYLLLSIIILSCSKSDDQKINSTSIIGKWRIVSIIEYGKPITGYSCNENFDVTEFFTDGMLIVKYADLNSSKVCTQYTENGNYTINGDILDDVRKNSKNVILYHKKSKITELTNKTLKLSTLYLYESNSTGTSTHTSNYNEGEDVVIYTKL